MVGPLKQRQLLEGVSVGVGVGVGVRFDAAGRVDLARYRWKPRVRR